MGFALFMLEVKKFKNCFQNLSLTLSLPFSDWAIGFGMPLWSPFFTFPRVLGNISPSQPLSRDPFKDSFIKVQGGPRVQWLMTPCAESGIQI